VSDAPGPPSALRDEDELSLDELPEPLELPEAPELLPEPPSVAVSLLLSFPVEFPLERSVSLPAFADPDPVGLGLPPPVPLYVLPPAFAAPGLVVFCPPPPEPAPPAPPAPAPPAPPPPAPPPPCAEAPPTWSAAIAPARINL
jgi:hypothetical protein